MNALNSLKKKKSSLELFNPNKDKMKKSEGE